MEPQSFSTGSSSGLWIRISVPDHLKRKRQEETPSPEECESSRRTKKPKSQSFNTEDVNAVLANLSSALPEPKFERRGGVNDVAVVHQPYQECPRNSIPAASSRKKASRSEFVVEQESNLVESGQGQVLLEALVAGSRFDLSTVKTQEFAGQVCSILKGEEWDVQNVFKQDSLDNLTLRVQRCVKVKAAVDFIYMFNVTSLKS
jgi:hypothetical protein